MTKPQKYSFRCPTCRQDMWEAPHRGLKDKDCPQCGQGMSWRKAKQKRNPKPNEMHLSIEEQRAACARFMGWKRICEGDWRDAHWMKSEDKDAVRISDYQPDADTPEGREQANELWQAINLVYDIRVVRCRTRDYFYFEIFEPCITDLASKRWQGKGETWNSALVSAVAKLQVQRETNGVGDDVRMDNRARCRTGTESNV